MATTNTELYDLMRKFPHLMSTYTQSHMGPTRQDLKKIDPRYGSHVGKEANFSLDQYNALQNQWHGQQADRMASIEDYYGFNPSDEQRQMLISGLGPQAKEDYYTHNYLRPWWMEKGGYGPGEEMKSKLATKAGEGASSLDKWLPTLDQEAGLFDTLYNYKPPVYESPGSQATDPYEGFTRNEGFTRREDFNPMGNGEGFTRTGKSYTGPRTLEEVRDYATRGGYSQMENILNGSGTTASGTASPQTGPQIIDQTGGIRGALATLIDQNPQIAQQLQGLNQQNLPGNT